MVDPKLEPPAEALNFLRGDLVFTIPPFDMRPRSLDSLVTSKVQTQIPSFRPGTPINRMPIEIRSPLSIELGGQVYPLVNVITQLDVTPHTHNVKALFNVCRRLSDKRNIALTSITKVNMKDKEIVFVILVKKDIAGDDSMSIKVHFLDGSVNKTTLPEGTVRG